MYKVAYRSQYDLWVEFMHDKIYRFQYDLSIFSMCTSFNNEFLSPISCLK